MSSQMITLTIDGKKITATNDQTVLEAALDNGIYIPHLCNHENLHPTGACRLCVAKQEGVEGVITSCTTKVQEGMIINTTDETAEKIRKLSVDLMFKTHPSECVGCPKYGKCQLQSISQYVGDTGRKLRTNPIRVAANAENPIILHEMYRCILCGRCVRACNEMRGVGAIRFEKVNDRMQVVVDGKTLEDAGCRFCSACVEVCPTGAIREHEEITEKMTGKTRETALVPCKEGCPAHINIPKYIRFINQGNYGAAAAVVREKAPFPHVLGHVCTHNCEVECKRNYLNSPVSIRELKRFAVSKDDGSWRTNTFQKPPTNKKVAIIGSGPAGLTAAYYMAKLGHLVTVFEKLPHAGGMMRYGIPEYRLPRTVIEEEVKEVIKLGVTIKYNHEIENASTLLHQGYDVVFVSTGAHNGVKLPLKGNDLAGVYVNTEFLRGIELKEDISIGERVLVLGGGNVALDCAGAARRLGAKEVHVACLESYDRMTASEEELNWAKEEGLILHNSKTFLEIMGDGTNVTGIKIAGVKSFSFDETGKSIIELEEQSEEVVAVDNIIFAVGQRPDINEEFGLALGRGNRILICDKTYATSVEGIYAAGDVVSGTTSVIQSIAKTREAVTAMDIYLGGDGNIEEQLSPDQDAKMWIGKIPGFVQTPRVEGNTELPDIRCNSFELMDFGYEEDQAICEAARCLQCDLRLKIAPQKFWSDYSEETKGTTADE